MIKYFFCLCSGLICGAAVAQTSIDLNPFNNHKKPTRKLLQKNHGAIMGLQRGAGTSFELGYEAHWRKLSLLKPTISGATANLEYDFAHHLIAYKAGMWMKRGRVNLTYGGNLVYFNDFNGMSRYGIGPAVGFRFAGFHFINGFNLLAGDKDLKVNTLYISLRYFFPVENKFTWDRKTLQRKKERRVEKERKKTLRQQDESEKKGLRKILGI